MIVGNGMIRVADIMMVDKNVEYYWWVRHIHTGICMFAKSD
jgi:hypothetical protein